MYPSELKYTKTHEWIRDEGNGVFAVGITEYAVSHLGDITFVEPPEIDAEAEIEKEVCTVESVKAVGDIYAPASGKVSEINESLEDKPELIQESPHEEGWLFKLQGVDVSQLDALMDVSAYEEYLAGLDE